MVKFYRRRPRPVTTRRHPRHLGTVTEDISESAAASLTREHLAPPERQGRWKPWYWLVAAALHVLVIALLLFFTRQKPEQEAMEPTGVSVVYAPGAPASQTPQKSQYSSPALPPPPPAPPPPPQVAQAEPNVNLNLPQDLFSPLEQAPPTPPLPAPQAEATPHPRSRAATHEYRPRPSQKYMVMNNMSLGTSGATSLSPTGQPGMNMSLPQSDAQAVMAPDVSVQGAFGADWGAAFNKWVYAHLYYPDAAREQNQQGDVTVSFVAHRDGSVTGLHLVSGSGSGFLDLAWQGIFADNQLPKFPPGGADAIPITATVHYELVP